MGCSTSYIKRKEKHRGLAMVSLEDKLLVCPLPRFAGVMTFFQTKFEQLVPMGATAELKF
jgi:hypothetical protein